MSQPSHAAEFAQSTPSGAEAGGLWQDQIREITGRLAVSGAVEHAHMHPVGEIDVYGEKVPALIGGFGEGHVAFSGVGESLDQDMDTARSLILQMLKSAPPGTVKLSVWNGYLGDYTDAFADFAASLKPAGLYERMDPYDLSSFLKRIENRNAELVEGRTQVGTRSNPWEIAVIMDDPNEDTHVVKDNELRQIDRIIKAGPKYGSIVTIGIPVQTNDKWLRRDWPLPVQYDKPIEPGEISRRCEAIATKALAAESPELSTILPEEMWTGNSRDGLKVSLGIGADGRPFIVEIGSENTQNAHAILTGPTSSGKGYALKTLITSLTQKYSPEEVKVLLLDYKESTEFASFAPHPEDPTFLPHAEVVGTNINKDPEFGIATLEYLQNEIEKRGERFKDIRATNYMELRANDPEGAWPRIVLAMDEFQVLAEDHRLGDRAVELLKDIAKRGRAFGIHLVLSTQTTEGIPALYTQHKALFDNFTLRLATPHGNMFNQHNMEADNLPPFHLLVNKNSGLLGDNQVVRVPDASTKEVNRYKQRAYEMLPKGTEPPRVFDGGLAPSLETAKDFVQLDLVDSEPKVLVAQEVGVQDASAGFSLSRDPGRNLAVIGSGEHRGETYNVLDTAARSLAKQQHPEDATFSLVYLDSRAEKAVSQTAAALLSQGHNANIVGQQEAASFLAAVNSSLETKTEQSHYVMVYGADSTTKTMTGPSVKVHEIAVENGNSPKVSPGSDVRAGLTSIIENEDRSSIRSSVTGTVAEVTDAMIKVHEPGKSGREELYELLASGPEHGVHVLASFASASQLGKVLSAKGYSAERDAIGAYIALGVPQNELSNFTPDDPLPKINGHDTSRKNRGLFYDRSSGKKPRVVVPYTGSEVATVADQDKK